MFVIRCIVPPLIIVTGQFLKFIDSRNTSRHGSVVPFSGLGWAGLGWVGLGLGWAGLGWAGLGWAGLAGLGSCRFCTPICFQHALRIEHGSFLSSSALGDVQDGQDQGDHNKPWATKDWQAKTDT